jgi:hypothetical protein
MKIFDRLIYFTWTVKTSLIDTPFFGSTRSRSNRFWCNRCRSNRCWSNRCCSNRCCSNRCCLNRCCLNRCWSNRCWSNRCWSNWCWSNICWLTHGFSVWPAVDRIDVDRQLADRGTTVRRSGFDKRNRNCFHWFCSEPSETIDNVRVCVEHEREREWETEMVRTDRQKGRVLTVAVVVEKILTVRQATKNTQN